MQTPSKLRSSVIILFFFTGLKAFSQSNGVGIDIPNPQQKLDVAGGIRIGNTTTGLAGSIRWTGAAFEGHDGTNWIPFGGSFMGYWSANGPDISNSNTGNVGIGNSLPQEKLHITGKIRVVDGTQGAGKVLMSDANGTTSWTHAPSINLLRDADNDTKIQVEESADEDLIRFDAAGSEMYTMRKLAGGSPWLEVNSTNTLIGKSISSAINGSGRWNTAVGFQSAQNLTTGQKNTYLGDNTGGSNTTGDWNTMLGTVAGQFNNGGSMNTMVGGNAGRSNLTGSGNVFIGFAAGENETGSSKLYIHNSSTANPLIYGDFSSGLLRINGTLNVNNSYNLPTGAGTNGFVLQTNGSGTASWVNPNTLAITETDPQVSASTTNVIPKWNGTALVDGVISDIGTTVNIASRIVNVGDNTSTAATFLNLVRSGSSGRIYLGSGATSPNMVIQAQTASGDIVLETVSGESMRVADGGNVGIGNALPQEKLHITGKIRMADGTQGTGKVLVSDANGSASWTDAASLTITETDPQVSSSTINIIPKWNGTTLQDGALYDNGNIGIGNALPQEKLHVTGKIRMVDGTQGTGKVLVSDANGSAAWADATTLTIAETDPQVSSSTINIIPKWNGTTLEDGALYDNGNIGIGNALPQEKLHVTGKIRIVDGTQGMGKVLVSDANGSAAWSNAPSVNLIQDADEDTKVQLEESADEDIIRFDLAGTEYLVLDNGRMNIKNTGGGTFLGNEAGQNDDLNGRFNSFVGYFSGRATTSGGDNAAFGAGSMETNTTGNGNTALGRSTLFRNVTGSDNVAIGTYALYQNLNGSRNVAIGSGAGANATGIANVFIGNDAGANETANDRLYIDNSNTMNPLIYGNFLSREAAINGNLGIGTQSPTQKLDVLGNVHVNSNILMFTDPQNSNSTIYLTANDAAYPNEGLSVRTLSSPANGKPLFRVLSSGGAERLRVEHNGRVYMDNKLDVVGQLTFRNGSPAAGKTLVSTDATGNATWSQGTENVAYTKSTGVYSHDNTNGYAAITGTASLSVFSGDVITIMANGSFRLDGGSGVDDFFFRVSYTGCATGNANETNYFPSEDANDHDNYVPVSYIDVMVAPCTGTLDFEFNARNVGDDPWTAEDRVLVVRRN
ncbi:MAG: hypothetical protein K9J17_11380 [Flavobacteriales bacterium]|nr:hypothetical protein [Flavobacteriales bacterium]